MSKEYTNSNAGLYLTILVACLLLLLTVMVLSMPNPFITTTALSEWGGLLG